jgi:hypothetical protein
MVTAHDVMRRMYHKQAMFKVHTCILMTASDIIHAPAYIYQLQHVEYVCWLISAREFSARGHVCSHKQLHEAAVQQNKRCRWCLQQPFGLSTTTTSNSIVQHLLQQRLTCSTHCCCLLIVGLLKCSNTVVPDPSSTSTAATATYCDAGAHDHPEQPVK